MVKTTININTRIKVKNIEIDEYERILNVWRACMLFFEREIRKLHDREEITTETLRKVADNIDFTELLRMNFVSIPDQERMRLVKLSEVAEAIQRVQQLSSQEIEQINSEATPSQNLYDEYNPEYQQSIELSELHQQNNEQVINPASSILQQADKGSNLERPQINVKEHLNVLQRNTASSVIELRKMMYQNIQKIRQTLSDEST